MSRYAATIDANGITADDYATTLAKLTADYLAIFGSDTIISPDTQDGQDIGIRALMIYEANAMAVATYNAFSPATAQGNGLSSVVKINGLKRNIPSASIVTLTLTGIAGQTLENAQASDGLNTWILPESVTIPQSGTIDVQAACATLGAITAAPGTITTRKTLLYGWQTVTNAAAATPGTPVETDAALRVRQSISTSLPAQNVFDGIIASIAAVAGVTRYRGYENDGNSADGNGLAAHTLEFFVEGGANANILNAIATKVTPGIPTAGEVSTTVIRSTGSTRTVAFSRGTQVTVAATITIKQLTGYSNSFQPAQQAAVQAVINSWAIGGDSDGKLSWAQIALAAMILGQNGAGTFKVESVALTKNGVATSPATNTDVTLAWNEIPVAGTVTITVT